MRRKKPKSLVLFGNGINCEYETAHANRLAGFDVDLHHINELNRNPSIIQRYTFLNFPGGFLDGDDLGAAKAQAVKWRYQAIGEGGRRVIDELISFVGKGGIMLGICNGFQLLVKTGLLPALSGSYGTQSVSLTFNDSGKFEDRWVYLKGDPLSPCVFTKGIENAYLPVRHGEGKLVADEGNLDRIEADHHVVLRYADEKGRVTADYPLNPNGSPRSIAGICDATGRIFGLMPHPEAYVSFTQHPRWTRERPPDEGDGIKIFQNAYKYVIEHL